MDDILELFPQWDDENADIEEVFQRIDEAEKLQKNAKANTFYKAEEIAMEMFETAPDEVKELHFSPDRGLFALRGYPFDAILGEQVFTVMFAETDTYLYEIHVFFLFDEDTQNIASGGILTRTKDGRTKDAWINGGWAKTWNMHDDGFHDCSKCESRNSCEFYLSDKYMRQQAKDCKKVAAKVRKDFPDVIKMLKKNGMNMVVIPD